MQNHSVAAFLFVLSVGAPFARAQCVNDWLPGDPFAGVAGEVYASVMHDPDGAGPLAPRLVVGGDIRFAGAAITRGIASWDPAAGQWSAVGGGLGSSVSALAVLPNNDLVAGGAFNTGGWWEVAALRWNGSTWSLLPGAFQPLGHATSMLVLPNGDLLVAGDIFLTDGVNTIDANVARWNGTDWVSMQTPSHATVDSLALLPNGDVLAAGQFLNWPNGDITRWNGSSWSAFATPIESVRALTALANGDVVCCGDLGATAQVGVHRWNGSAWNTLGFVGDVRTIREESNGDLLIGGELSLPGFADPALVRWNGSTWQAVGTSRGRVATTTPSPSGGLHACGAWIDTGGGSVANVAEVVATAWTRLGEGTDGDVSVALDLGNGDLVVAGDFKEIGGVRANGLARWNGASWAPLGSGVDGTVLDIAEMANGDLVVCGEFASAGGVAVTNIARWNGVSWSSLGWIDPLAGFGAPRAIRALAVMPNGDLMIGGDFSAFFTQPGPRYVARFDGATWHSVGVGTNLFVRDMVVLRNGDLVVCGWFTTVEASALALRVARWDGTHWSPMGIGMNNPVEHVFLDARGDLIATGPFTLADNNVANGIARWTGSSWSAVGAIAGAPSWPTAAPLPDGDLVRANPTQGQLERWDGVAWSPMVANTFPKCLVMRSNGELFVGGMQMVNNTLSMGYARYATNCPATSFAFGGCPSSGGANRLVAEQLPYSDGVLRSLASGTSTPALAVVVTGFTSLPSPIALSALLPNAGAGCTLAVTDDILQLQTTTSGTVRSTLAIPSSPPVVGLSFFQQMVLLGIDPVLGIVESTSTNTLRLTVGSF